MSLRKQLIKLNNRLEKTWCKVDFSQTNVDLKAGWYVSEFLIPGMIDHTPRVIVTNNRGNDVERALVGSHAGRNRMLFFLPAGSLKAHSKSVELERLARVSSLEGRARVLLICGRYLLDFFSLKVLFKMIIMQFQDPYELSGNLLKFYEPAGGTDGYLHNITSWQKFRGFGKPLAWLVGGIKIAVIIEHPSQRAALAELLVPADYIIDAGEAIPEDVDYCLPLSRTECLREPAILMLKRAIKQAKVRPNYVYTDHDYRVIGDQTAQHPVFKPSPSRPYLHCFNYVGFAFAINSDAARSVGSEALLQTDTQYTLALAAFSDVERVLHVSEALFMSDRTSSLETPAPPNNKSNWSNILWQRRANYNVLVADPDWHDRPGVDLIIPTRDGLAVLQPCVESILTKTDYPDFSIIIVDNGSEQAETLAFFSEVQQDPRVKVIEYPGEFNYSAINNFAAAQGNSEYIALINNDIEVIGGDWLTQMMVWATQPDVGIVGAKLLFGNGKVQHAGVTIGMGNAAGHIHRLEEGDAPGYQLRCLATQNMMAVTAACLVTPRSLFEQLGGLNEESFKVAYNDIDYCLRVEALGQDVIWTPEATLFHHESVSRGDDLSDQHVERYFRELAELQRRWKCKGFVDKYYSKHLRISDEGVYPQIEQAQKDDLFFIGSNN